MAEATPDLIQTALLDPRYSVDDATGWVLHDGQPIGHATPDGYISVRVGDRRFVAHRVVWTATHGPIPSGMQVNHRNGRRWDNRPINLDLVTARQNIHHAQGGPHYEGVRPADIEAVDPTWLAHVLELKSANPSHDEVRALLPHGNTAEPLPHVAAPSVLVGRSLRKPL